jgi:bifunctional non-homologous end joining protein LigD
VSVPVEWDELSDALQSKDAESLFFTPQQALKRVEESGDLFKPVLTQVQKLPAEVRRYFEQQHAPTARHNEALEPYAAKRNFKKTAEPKPGGVHRSRQGSRRRFVIQKHAASHLHYDFRLEMHDVLKSWSVPKGPPFKKDERRLAMPTEDHPIEYLDFEGVIPKGQYGGGTVMVWDIGTYEIIEGNYYKGFLRFYLTGNKLKGEWTITRFAGSKDERDNRDKWHLIKTGRNTRAVSKQRDDESALTKRTMREIASAADAVWQSNRK